MFLIFPTWWLAKYILLCLWRLHGCMFFFFISRVWIVTKTNRFISCRTVILYSLFLLLMTNKRGRWKRRSGKCMITALMLDVLRPMRSSFSFHTTVQIISRVRFPIYFHCMTLSFILVALWNRADHYIFVMCFFLLSSFFFSSPDLSRRRLNVCHTSTHGV